MAENENKFEVIYEELKRISENPEIWLSQQEIAELDEISAIRQIVQQIQMPNQSYYTST
jgi:hypothetical protein